MKVLIIGGTVFLGRHLTEAMRRRGHVVTHFNRGRSAPDAFPDVELLKGDRERDLGLLAGRRWDAVIDTCAYRPRETAATAAALRDVVDRYVLISTVNQYAGFPVPWITEDAASEAELTAPDPRLDAVSYGPLKVGCERTVREAFGERALVIRPGYLVGPYDRSERFPYWTRRLAVGGRVLAPGRADAAWQVIDARDLAQWVALMLEDGRTGTFNAVGPAGESTAGALLTEMAEALGGADLVWVDAEYLRKRPKGLRWLDLADWSCLPEKLRWLYAVSNQKAVKAGLVFRPVGETARDMAAWLSRQTSVDGRGSLDLLSEEAILEGWGGATA